MRLVLVMFGRLLQVCTGRFVLCMTLGTLNVAGALAADALSALPNYDRVRILQRPRVISEAELTDQDGKTFRLSQLHGKVTFVFFGFTNCPDVCPIAMEKFREFHDSGALDLDRVSFVLISVDGERDTPEVLKSYLSKFSPDFIGLTGKPDDIKPIVKEFSASFHKGTVSDDSGNYSVMHSPQAFVLDRDGLVRAEFYRPTVEAMAAVTEALLTDGE
jgi:protein SCO1/2